MQPQTPETVMDSALASLNAHKTEWARLPISGKRRFLGQLRVLLRDVAGQIELNRYDAAESQFPGCQHLDSRVVNY